MIVGIVGMGLIGGSMAKSIKANTRHTVLGCDINETEMEKAELLGVVDGRITDETLPECGVVLITLYPKDIVRYVKENSGRFGNAALVIDCGGVKEVIYDELYNITKNKSFTFIGGHPMAGREYSGFRYAADDLFFNAPMILTPYPDTPIETISRAKEFFLEIGFGRVVFSTPGEHDEMIAYTSQMAHVISSAYVQSALAFKHKGFSAGSFKDMTRVARLNEYMWAELFLLNRKNLLGELDGIIDRLIIYRDALAASDEERLISLLRCGRERKEGLES